MCYWEMNTWLHKHYLKNKVHLEASSLPSLEKLSFSIAKGEIVQILLGDSKYYWNLARTCPII